MKRRDFLKAGVAGSALGSVGLLSWTPRVLATTINKTFYITDGLKTMVTGENVYFRGFSQRNNSLDIPGESIIAMQGDTIRINIENTLPTTHSFVIDGVVDSGPIAGGASRTVEFVVADHGSYLYYDALNAPYNRLLGLHGGLAVMPQGSSTELYPGSPDFVQQYFWVFNDIDPLWHNAVANGQTPNTPYVPAYFTLNGLGGRPPGAPGSHDPNIDAMVDPRSALKGSVGDRTLIRMFNAGLADQSVHCHGNHMEWLTENGSIRPDIWSKDCIYLEGRMGSVDAIYPFEMPPDAWPPTSTSTYPMHLHTEMSQTAGGGYYMFGSITDIFFV